MAGKESVMENTRSSRKPSRFTSLVEQEELEFIQAIENFKRDNRQPFPSWSEVLGVLKGLGYTRQEPCDREA